MTRTHRLSLVNAAALLIALAASACSQTSTSPAPSSSAVAVAEERQGGSTAKTETGPKATAPAAASGPEVGKPAPDFTLPDLDGKTVQLSQFKGKTVVLEWFNPDCPFVKANHTKGSLKGMAKRFTDKGIVWLAVNSNAAGKQGHGADVNRKGKETYGIDYPILLDEKGEVGKTYGARTTPHMYIIDPQGVLVYKGAIDNTPGSDPEPEDKVVNYVETALGELSAGKPVTTKETEPYGCSVKYASK
jgi:peroxiredoxin